MALLTTRRAPPTAPVPAAGRRLRRSLGIATWAVALLACVAVWIGAVLAVMAYF